MNLWEAEVAVSQDHTTAFQARQQSENMAPKKREREREKKMGSLFCTLLARQKRYLRRERSGKQESGGKSNQGLYFPYC